MTGRGPQVRRLGAVPLAAAAGTAWGLGGYLVLWGHTPLVVHRPFVVSGLGTVVLFPVRTVLWGIRLVEERIVDRSFDFSESSEWIGAVSGAVGAAVLVLIVLAVRTATRGVRAAGAPR